MAVVVNEPANGLVLITFPRIRNDEFRRALALCDTTLDEVHVGQRLNPFTPPAQRRRLAEMEAGR